MQAFSSCGHLKYLFNFGCAGSLLLYVQAFSSCGKRELLLVMERKLLIAVASLFAEHRP